MKMQIKLFALVATGLVLMFGQGVHAKDAVEANEAVSVEEGTKDPFDAEVEEVIRGLSERLKAVRNFRMEVVDTHDEMLDSGQKVQFAHRRMATVSRPDRFVVDTKGDLSDRVFVKSKETVTLYDRAHGVFGELPLKANNDEVIDILQERYGVRVPLADLLSGDIYEVMVKKAISAEYLGLHMVDKHDCHHIAVQQENLDWQVWIEASENPKLRKLLLTFKKLPGQPQYTMWVKMIEELESVPDDTFVFVPGKDVHKIRFVSTDDETPVDKNAP